MPPIPKNPSTTITIFLNNANANPPKPNQSSHNALPTPIHPLQLPQQPLMLFPNPIPLSTLR